MRIYKNNCQRYAFSTVVNLQSSHVKVSTKWEGEPSVEALQKELAELRKSLDATVTEKQEVRRIYAFMPSS